MNMKRTIYNLAKLSVTMAIVLSFVFGATTIGCASYPTGGIDLVVPFSPGGGTDLVARVMAAALTKKWHKPVNVVNKPGGNCAIGTNDVMRAAPDGYTILMDGGASSSLQVLIPNLPYNVEKRTFIVGHSAMPGVYVVKANSPYRTLGDVVKDAKKDLANFTWVSLGGTTQTDMISKQFFVTAGIDISKTKPIMYTGGGAGFNAVAGGHVKFSASGMGSAVPLKDSGLIKCLAITSQKRLMDWPEVETTAEQGFPGMNTVIWFGFSGPLGLPEEVIISWNKAVQEVLAEPEVVTKLQRTASIPMFLPSSDYKKYVLEDCERVKQLLGGK
jgi:tripartite-type tricarboxylate transporter receptor subunit TctC